MTNSENFNSFYDKQASLYIKTNKDNAFLTRTLLDGNIELFEALLKNGVRRGINMCLVVVIDKGLSQYYARLLELGANPNQLSLRTSKHSLLVDASQKKQHDLSQLLINYGASTSVYRHDKGTVEQGPCLDGLTLPTESLEEKYQRQAVVLIEEGQAEEALCVAAYINATAFARFLFSKDIKVNVPSNLLTFQKEQKLTAFEIFCINDNRVAIQFCIDGGVSPNELHGTHYPLALAVIYKKHGVVILLIENGTHAGINEGLILAIQNNDHKMLLLLLVHGADANRKDILIAGAKSKNRDIVDSLLNHGAKIDAKEALMIAINEDDDAITPLLFEHVENINLPPTLVIDKITEEKHVMAIVLLNNHANVNATNLNGVTAMMRAVNNNDIQAVNLLLEFKPDLNMRANKHHALLPNGKTITEDNNILGLTAIEIASRRGLQHIVNLLLDKGAAPSQLPQAVQNTALSQYKKVQLSSTSRIETRTKCVIL